ncbi:MAG TPA: amino acid adenylation domain-containing protein [Candidatus Dormibacteraeota bacterium]|jgi:aspartate racemase|nr:amino acid adenylation domain-containing protein [Candidatus Dormibacteraeota bacterium]
MSTDLERIESAQGAAPQRQPRKVAAPAAPIPRRARKGPVPASFGQRQLWFLTELAGDSPVYNESVTIQCPEDIEIPALEKAFNEILRRHEAWRTVLRPDGDDVVQVVISHQDMALRIVDLRHLDPPDQEGEANRISTEDVRQPFDDERPPWRAMLIRLEDGYRIHLTIRQVLFDPASLHRVLLPELVALHESFRAVHASPLPDPPIQYGDYAVWQRGRVREPEVVAQLAHWREQLRDLSPLELPTDRPRPAVESFRGGFQALSLAAPMVRKLRELGRAEGTDLFTATLAGFLCLLQRVSGQDDLPVGTVSPGRRRPELEGMLGYFLNPLVLRCDLSGEPTFRELLARVRDTTQVAMANDEVPFEDVVRALQPERRPDANPLFQVVYTLEEAGPELPPGWGVTQMDVDTGTSKFDLQLELEERREGLAGRLIYSTELFDDATVEHLAGDLRVMLEALVLEPDLPVTELALPLRRTIPAMRGPMPPLPDQSISQRFEEIAERWPDRVAVSFGNQELTYASLNARADNLARRLREAGVTPEEMVGIMVDRSTEMAVGLLGILKANGAYVPLNPRDPDQRIELLARDARCRVVVATRADRERVPPDVEAVFIDDISDRPDPGAGPLPHPPGGTSLAYLLYTSGSTGRPKGVMVEHRSVLRLVCPATYCELGSDQILLQLAPLSFDASTFEIWGALLNGGRLVVAPRGLLSAREIGDVVERRGVNTLWLTAGLFCQVVDAGMPGLGGVKQLLTGGEVLSAAHCRRALELMPGLRLINGYGPTEATGFSCCHQITAADLELDRVPIGRPIGNTVVHVVDDHGRPAPVGASGELYVSGPGVARGYLGAPALTEERFVPDPEGGPDARRYRTGDMVRVRPGGTLDFLGRRDRQIKIRGFRIEPGEIEAVLREHPQVADAVVVAPELPAQGKRLVAYIVSGGPPADLMSFVARRLPAHMVPQTYVGLDSLPLNVNGKVDHSVLPTFPVPAVEVSNKGPRTELEGEVGALWAELLDRPSVPLDVDFFRLGGHSLLAMRMIAEVERRFASRLPLEVVFGPGSTARRLAGLIQRTPRVEGVQGSDWVVPLRPSGARAPFFIVAPNRESSVAMRHLLPHLDPSQPVIALLAPTRDGHFDVAAGIPGLADELLEQVRAIQPHGPYRLAGYSLGGLLAYQIAGRLEEAGEEVVYCALLDTVVPAMARTEARIDRRSRGRRQGIGGFFRGDDDDGAVEEEEFDWDGAAALSEAYRPRTLELPLTVIGSRAQRRWAGENGLGWSEVHGGPIDARGVPGDHRSMLLEPNVAELAALVAAGIRATT